MYQPCPIKENTYMERMKTEERLRRINSRFALLVQTAEELLQSRKPQEVIESLCVKIMGHLDCHVFFNFLVDENAGKLHLNAYAGISFEEAKRIEWIEYGEAVCGCVARDCTRIVAERIPTTL